MHQSENVWQIIYWLQFYVHFGCMFLHLTGLQEFLTVVYRMVSTFCNWHCRSWWRFWSWCRGMLLNWLMVNCCIFVVLQFYRCTYTHTRWLTALCPGLPGWAGTRKVNLIWILLKQETVSGSGFSWAICKSAPCSRQITTPAPHHSVFYRPDALPATQPTASKHWRHQCTWASVNKSHVITMYSV